MLFKIILKRVKKFTFVIINLPYFNFKIIFFLKKVYSYTPWRIRTFLKIKFFYSMLFSKGDLCFDIGANMGRYTKIFLQLGARVVSVDPQKTCLKILNKLYGRNKSVKIVGKAVNSSEGVKEMIICNKSSSLSTLSRKWMNESRHSDKFDQIKKQKVELTTLDKLIKLYGLPKFCKIDVEGYELEVLKGLSKKIPFLCFEFVKEFLYETKKCIKRILSIGSAKFNFTIGKNYEFFFRNWVNDIQIFEILTSIDNNLLWGDVYVKFL